MQQNFNDLKFPPQYVETGTKLSGALLAALLVASMGLVLITFLH